VCWFTDSELSVGDAIIVRHASGEVSARVAAITHRLDLETLENTPTDRLVLNDIGRVELALASTLVVDEYTVNRAGGSAIAIDPVTNATIGALMIRSGY
jgi:sulfate adenylyltransferase subunit 1